MGSATVLVTYDESSAATPTQLARAAADDALVFLLPDQVPPQVRGLLGLLGDVVDWADQAAVERLRPDAVVTFAETLVAPTADLAAGWGLPGLAPDLARVVQDKVYQRRQLREAGVDHVRFAAVDDIVCLPEGVALVGMPCVVKPRRGTGSRWAYLVRSEDDRAAMLADLAARRPVIDGWIVEEELRGTAPEGYADYVSVEVLARADGPVPLLVTSKLPLAPPFREQGGVAPSVLAGPRLADVQDKACAAVAALGLTTGLAHVELKLTEPEVHLLEVNPRLGGYQENLAEAAGCASLVRIAYDAALGRPLPEGPLPAGAVGWWFAPSAPMDQQRVAAFTGTDIVRALPDVLRVHQRVAPGTEIDWRRGWGQYLALAEGRSGSAEAALATIATVAKTFVAEYG